MTPVEVLDAIDMDLSFAFDEGQSGFSDLAYVADSSIYEGIVSAGGMLIVGDQKFQISIQEVDW